MERANQSQSKVRLIEMRAARMLLVYLTNFNFILVFDGWCSVAAFVEWYVQVIWNAYFFTKLIFLVIIFNNFSYSDCYSQCSVPIVEKYCNSTVPVTLSKVFIGRVIGLHIFIKNFPHKNCRFFMFICKWFFFILGAMEKIFEELGESNLLPNECKKLAEIPSDLEEKNLESRNFSEKIAVFNSIILLVSVIHLSYFL